MKTAVLGFVRARRLLTPEAFKRVFNNRKRSSDSVLVVLTRRNECGHARLGFALSTRAAKSAVDRNRIKRVIRDSFRHSQVWLGAQDYVVTARHGVALKTNQELRVAMEKHWLALVECKRS